MNFREDQIPAPNPSNNLLGASHLMTAFRLSSLAQLIFRVDTSKLPRLQLRDPGVQTFLISDKEIPLSIAIPAISMSREITRSRALNSDRELLRLLTLRVYQQCRHAAQKKCRKLHIHENPFRSDDLCALAPYLSR